MTYDAYIHIDVTPTKEMDDNDNNADCSKTKEGKKEWLFANSSHSKYFLLI